MLLASLALQLAETRGQLTAAAKAALASGLASIRELEVSAARRLPDDGVGRTRVVVWALAVHCVHFDQFSTCCSVQRVRHAA